MSDWKSTMDGITALAAEHGLEFHELRNAWARVYVESGSWPKDEGMGSSDMNHLVHSAFRFDHEELTDLARETAADKKFRADLEAQGVDLEALRRLLAT